jgi:hypothetical protein
VNIRAHFKINRGVLHKVTVCSEPLDLCAMHLQARPRAVSSAPSTRRSAINRSRIVVCDAADKKKVIVVGGTGRVGSATASSLLENFGDQYDVSVSGRTRENFEKIVQLRPRLQGARFVPCDITDLEAVKVSPQRCCIGHLLS